MAPLAQASPITYYYTGANYNLYSNYPSTANAPYSCLAGQPCYLDITMTLASALAPDLNVYNITPTSFQFTDGDPSDTVTDATANLIANFFFSTDAEGNITQWDVFAQTNNGAIVTMQLLTLNFPGAGDQLDDTVFLPCESCNVIQYFAYSNGAWSTTPPVTTPEPATWLLSSTGVLALLGMALVSDRRRRAQQPAANS
ncbi:MAG TPA: hypothetical protein VFP94_00775 [Terriglobales bacterium]|nr:hypothetical protein [Terriglobales bacterium]